MKATTNLSLQQPGTQGHKGVNPACRGEELSSALTELYTSRSVLIDLYVLKGFNWLVYLDRKLTEYVDVFIIFLGQFCNYIVIFWKDSQQHFYCIPSIQSAPCLLSPCMDVYNNGKARANIKSIKVLKYVIQSTVNNSQGARPVESLLLGRQ